MDQINQVLDNTNMYCSSVSGFSAISSVTASPTTTGPFTSYFTRATTDTARHPDLTFPIWTGLSTLADPSFYSDLNAEIESREATASTVVPIEGPTISQGSSMAATGTGMPMSGEEPSSVQPSSAAAASAAPAQTSGGTGLTKEMRGVTALGLAAVILGLLLALKLDDNSRGCLRSPKSFYNMFGVLWFQEK